MTWNMATRSVKRTEAVAIDQLAFERGKEALAHGIAIRITS